MWWRLLTVGLAFSLVTALTWPGANRITNADQRPVTIATLPCAKNLQSTSSGFVIDDELVVTVAHAIFDSRDFAVRDSNGRWHRAVVRYMDLERDLAVLEVSGLRASALHMRVGSSGDEVRMLDGAASGTVTGQLLRRVRISTEVIGDRERDSRRSGYELTIEISGGDSGAAVLDENGSLLGMIFARSTQREASWATSVAEMNGITTATGVPEWSCDSESQTELILEPVAEPTLAN